jgi:hypothetical protein
MKIFSILLLFSSRNLFAIDCFMPKNDLKISIDSKYRNDMTEENFNLIIDRVNNVYSPIVKSKKGNLFFSRNWKDDTVNASANRFGGNAWFVNMYGGLARHPLVTDDGFMLVVCHELGHHLGGTPTKGGITGFWASTEGQADYFGALKCMRRILANDDNELIIKNSPIDPTINQKCNDLYKNNNEAALCKRIGMAGISLANLLGSFKGDTNLSVDTPDPTIVKKSNPDHPNAQCRLDTYFNADLCPINYNTDVDKKDPTIGVCTKKIGLGFGTRPLCWYRPTKKEL